MNVRESHAVNEPAGSRSIARSRMAWNWKSWATKAWNAVHVVEELWGKLTFIVAIVAGLVTMIWAWFMDATAPFFIPAGLLSVAAVLYIADRVRGRMVGMSSPPTTERDSRVSELLPGALNT